MAVFKRRLCTVCGHGVQDARLVKVLPPCSKCGGATTYAPSWYVSVRVRTPAGFQKVTKAAGSTKEAAVQEERRLLGERDNGAVERPGAKTDFPHVAATFETWVEERKSQGKLAEGSARSYGYRLSAHLTPFFGRTDVRQIDHEAADRYVRARRASGCRPATINREVATLKRLLSIAVKKRLISVNPLLGYELLPEDNCRDVHLTREQIAKLLKEAQQPRYPEHLYPLLVVALHTGLRREGCLTLRWEEIDWKRGEMTKVVKGGTTVHVPLTAQAKQTLETWRDRGGVQRVSGFCFPSPKTGKAMLVTSEFGFKAACKAVGLSLHWHDLRHTFATLFLEQFPDQIETLRVLLGHTSAYITRRYAHITDRTRHETMRNFEIGG